MDDDVQFRQPNSSMFDAHFDVHSRPTEDKTIRMRSFEHRNPGDSENLSAQDLPNFDI